MQSLTELLKTTFSCSIFLTSLNSCSLNTGDRALFVNEFFQDVVHSLSSPRRIAADSPFPLARGTEGILSILHAHPDDPLTVKSL